MTPTLTTVLLRARFIYPTQTTLSPSQKLYLNHPTLRNNHRHQRVLRSLHLFS